MSDEELGADQTLIMEVPRTSSGEASSAEPVLPPSVEHHPTLVSMPAAVPRPERPLPPPTFEISPVKVLPTPSGDTVELDIVDPATFVRPLSQPRVSSSSQPSDPDEPATSLRQPSHPQGVPDPADARAFSRPEEHPVIATRVIPWQPPAPRPLSPPTDDPGLATPNFDPPKPIAPVGPLAIGALAGLIALLVVGGAASIYLINARRSGGATGSAAAVSASAAAVSASAAAISVSAAPSPGPDPIQSGMPSEAATASSAAPIASSSANSPSDATAGDSDAKAKAALERLRSGIDACVKRTIHILPGTSPAVPESLSWLKHGPYQSLKRDWVNPFFSCTHFKIEEPMPFVIQWQLEKPGNHGSAIAWIDDDRDGKAERAFGFTARQKKHDEVELGPIEPMTPSLKIKKR